MSYAMRFSRVGATIPTTWTYPGTGEHEGAQVWRLDKGVETLRAGGRAKGWHDGYTYSPRNGYHDVLILEVSGYSGDKGPLKWKAVTEDDVERVWMLSWRDAQKALAELERELDEEGVLVSEESWDDDLCWTIGEMLVSEERVAEALIACATEVEPTFGCTIAAGQVKA